MTVSAEGRVENQKLNQTAALLSFGSVFGFQLDSLEKHLITLAILTFTPKVIVDTELLPCIWFIILLENFPRFQHTIPRSSTI